MCAYWLFKTWVWLSLSWYCSTSSTPFPKPFLLQHLSLQDLVPLSSRPFACFLGVGGVSSACFGNQDCPPQGELVGQLLQPVRFSCQVGTRNTRWDVASCSCRHSPSQMHSSSLGVFRRTRNPGSKNSVNFGKVLFYSKTGLPTGGNKSKLKILGF